MLIRYSIALFANLSLCTRKSPLYLQHGLYDMRRMMAMDCVGPAVEGQAVGMPSWTLQSREHFRLVKSHEVRTPRDIKCWVIKGLNVISRTKHLHQFHQSAVQRDILQECMQSCHMHNTSTDVDMYACA